MCSQTAKPGIKQCIFRTGQDGAAVGNKSRICNVSTTGGLVEKDVTIVGTIGQIIDGKNAVGPASAGAFKRGVKRIIIDHEKITGRAYTPPQTFRIVVSIEQDRGECTPR
jgi:hypothetical protein